MKMVMGVSDRIVCLNQGRIIASGTPAEIQRNPEVIRAYLGERYAPCSRLKARAAATARSRPCASCRSRCDRASSSRLIGANGAGKTTTLKAISGVLRAGRGPHHLQGEDITRASRAAHPAARHRALPGGPPRVSLHDGAREPGDGLLPAHATGGHRRRHGAAVRALPDPAPSGATRRPARCRAASSRCWRSRAR